jgi:hypothetical protein
MITFLVSWGKLAKAYSALSAVYPGIHAKHASKVSTGRFCSRYATAGLTRQAGECPAHYDLPTMILPLSHGNIRTQSPPAVVAARRTNRAAPFAGESGKQTHFDHNDEIQV